MVKSLSHTNFMDSFCCVECIMEISWFHYHFPSPLLLLHIFFISTVFFSLLSLPLIICFFVACRFALSSIHCQLVCFQPSFGYSHDWWIFASFFFHAVDGDGVFKSLLYISK
jgi:hypothetical protein